MKVRPHLPHSLRPALRHWLLTGTVATLATLLAAPALAADPKASRFYEDALTRYEQNDLPGAIIQLKNALQIDKGLLPVHVLLGKALLRQGDLIAAEVALSEALRLGVNRAEVVVQLAEALVNQGKPQIVLTDARFEVAGLPAGVQFRLLLVRAGAFVDVGKPADGLRAIEQARALTPSSTPGWQRFRLASAVASSPWHKPPLSRPWSSRPAKQNRNTRAGRSRTPRASSTKRWVGTAAP